MNKKDAGFAQKLLPVLLSTGMVFGLILLSGQFMQTIRTKEWLHQTVRTYLLKMEATGYLQEHDLRMLKTELEEQGLQNPDFSGTTVHQVGYGEKISLTVSGTIVCDLKVVMPFIYGKSMTWSVPVTISLYSTAKH